MYWKTMMGGEGASTPTFGPRVMAVPAVVVWPATTHGSVPFEASQDLYRLAYEWALVMMRPGGYELANRIAPN
jgi:hypothetical protein